MVRKELLRKFGLAEGRRSRVFKSAAIVGRRGRNRCALATAAGTGGCEDYHLIHVIPMAPEEVDHNPNNVFSQADEYRLYSWTGLIEFLEAFGGGANDYELWQITARSCAHRL